MPPRISFILCLFILLALAACNLNMTATRPLPSNLPTPTAALSLSEQTEHLFAPLIVDSSTAESSVAPLATSQSTPFMYLGEPSSTDVLTITPTPEDLRGQRVPIAGKWVQLPPDAYWDRNIPPIPPEVLPGAKVLSLPVIILRRDPYVVAVSYLTGEMYFPSPTAEKRSEAIHAFDFMIQVLGTENILPPDETCIDCISTESPLPTPTSW